MSRVACSILGIPLFYDQHRARASHKLEQLASLRDEHLDVLLVVRDLEQAWGRGARVAEIAKLSGRIEVETRSMLQEIAAAGYLNSDGLRDEVWIDSGLPILGEVG